MSLDDKPMIPNVAQMEMYHVQVINEQNATDVENVCARLSCEGINPVGRISATVVFLLYCYYIRKTYHNINCNWSVFVVDFFFRASLKQIADL